MGPVGPWPTATVLSFPDDTSPKDIMQASPPSGQPAWKPVSAWNELEIAAYANQLAYTELPRAVELALLLRIRNAIDFVLVTMVVLGIIVIVGVFRLFIG